MADVLVQIRISERLAQGLDKMAAARGVSRSEYALVLLQAAYSARCAPTGDEALDAAVAAIDVAREPSPPVAALSDIQTIETAPPLLEALKNAARLQKETAAGAPQVGFGCTKRASGGAAAGRCLAASPLIAPDPAIELPMPSIQRTIRMLRWQMRLRPFDIARQLGIPLAQVHAVIAADSRQKRGRI
jgi:hypothetical protein